METNEPFDIAGYLAEPIRPAQLSAVSPSGLPLLGSVWFLFEDGQFWFTSHSDRPFPRAIRAGSQVAVLVDDFRPPKSIRQIRIRGDATIQPMESDRVDRMYSRYLGPVRADWPSQFRDRPEDPEFLLISVPPTTGLAVSFADFAGAEVRWSRMEDCPLPP